MKNLEANLKDLTFQNSSLINQLEQLRSHLQEQSNNFLAKSKENEGLIEKTLKNHENQRMELEIVKKELEETIKTKENVERERLEEIRKREELAALLR
jgi:hypothetical protein